jgi:hypothetical protein
MEKPSATPNVEERALEVFGPRPRGAKVGRWRCMRSLAQFIIEGPEHRRSVREIKFNWSLREGLRPQKAEEYINHLSLITGPNGEAIIKRELIENKPFIRWVYEAK